MFIPCAAVETFSKTELTFIPLLIYASFFFIVLVISYFVGASRHFKTVGKELKLMRMEFGKLAEEVKQVRQALKHE